MGNIAMKMGNTGTNGSRNWQRLTFRALILLLGLSIMVGCSSGSHSSDDSTDSTDDTNLAATEEDESAVDANSGATTLAASTLNVTTLAATTLTNSDSGGITDSGGNSSNYDKTGAYEQDGGTNTETGVIYTATESDESGVYVYGGGIYNLTDGTVKKTGGNTSGDDASNFYGLNASVLAEDQSTITLTNCTVYSTTEGSNGVFAYGEGSTVYVEGCRIETEGNSARGVDATYGGIIEVSDTTINTEGDHCGALATDRYENNDPPTVIAYDVTATTQGEGSPGIYCTGTFSVSNSDLVAYGSEAAAIEGLNSITLTNSDITGSFKWGVIIYQSMSGNSSVGTGTFTMTGGTLTNNSSGPLFFVCDTDAVIELDGAKLVNSTSSGMLLVAGTAAGADGYIDNVNTDWGTNGGEVTFTATDQTLEGDIIICDSSSSVDLTLTGTTTYTGAINSDDNGTADLVIGAGCTWTATGTSYLTSLTNNGGTISGTGVVYEGATQVYP